MDDVRRPDLAPDEAAEHVGRLMELHRAVTEAEQAVAAKLKELKAKRAALRDCRRDAEDYLDVLLPLPDHVPVHRGPAWDHVEVPEDEIGENGRVEYDDDHVNDPTNPTGDPDTATGED